MQKKILYLTLLINLSLFPIVAEAVPCGILPDNIQYDAEITTPHSFLGFCPGEWHIRHDVLVAYLKLLADESDRIQIKEYGRTYQLRALVLITVTTPENHQNIDLIREQHVKLVNPELSGGLDISSMPVVNWLGYSIHGREPSGANAVPVVAYYLAAAQGDEIDQILENSILLIDPSQNPDGHDRFATWVNNNQSHTTHSDANHREHWQAWPGSRTNHYWFDLNRDWTLVQQPESRYRARQFQKWKPNLLGDYHEMGPDNTYYFNPGVPSRNHPYIPDKTIELTNKLAQFHAEYLNTVEQLYWTEERFDSFNPGMGSTYPNFQGGVGVLFEQASARGHLRESAYGEILFRDGIHNQFLTSLSLMKGGIELRTELLEHKRDFFLQAQQKANDDGIKAYVFGDERDSAKSYHFIDILDHHDIEVYSLAQELETNGVKFKPGTSWVVPVDQPQYILLKGLFEKKTVFEDSLFYDVSTWTLPLAFDLQYAELNSRNYSEELKGNRLAIPEFPQGNLFGGRSNYAYLFEWSSYYAPRSLYRLQEKGVKTLVAKRTFVKNTSEGEKHFDYGTIVVSTGMQDKVDQDELYALMQTITGKDGVDIYSVSTGLTKEGIDIGSSISVLPLDKPRVMVITGRGINAYEAGEVWHLMDRRYEIPVSMMDWNRLNNADLSRYNTIVLVDGNYNALDNSHVRALAEWVRNGGTLITQKRGVQWAVNQGLHSGKFRENPSTITENDELNTYLNQTNLEDAQRIGGAIFQASVDRTHPLGYGIRGDRLPVFRNSELVFELPSPENIFAVPIRYTNNPLLSGYISDIQHDRLRNSPVIYNARAGSGRVIAMTDNPNFRAYWFGTNKLFANALFFNSIIRQSSLE